MTSLTLPGMATCAQGKHLIMALRNRSKVTNSGVSLARGPVGIAGLVLLAYGITGLIFGGQSFDEAATAGNVNGETWLGIEGNGWSNLLAIGAGGLLLFGAQFHVFAKAMALIVGFGFAAAAVIAIIDGSDVLGIFAANNATKLAWAIAAAVLIAIALLPRVGRKKEDPGAVRADETTRADEPTAMQERTHDDGTSRFGRDRDQDGVPDRAEGAVSERRVENR
jgi:hypothetical protein